MLTCWQPAKMCSYQLVHFQEHSEDHKLVSDDIWNLWCECRVIVEQIETLNNEDLNASGQSSLNLV